MNDIAVTTAEYTNPPSSEVNGIWSEEQQLAGLGLTTQSRQLKSKQGMTKLDYLLIAVHRKKLL